MEDNQEKMAVGTAGWIDLTVDDAEPLSAFYARVVGWQVEPLSMGDYSDFVMKAPVSGEGKAGICHARGSNAGIPPVWLPYFIVEDLDAALNEASQGGGRLVHGPRSIGPSKFAIIQDPAGAYCGLYQQ